MPEKEDEFAFRKIVELLDGAKISYTTLDHAPCRTSEDSAKVRGVSLDSGAKAMVVRELKTGVFYLAVMSASKKLSWKNMKAILNSKKVELAKTEDVFSVSKCLSGAVPPFGSIFGLKTYCDNSLHLQGETINFNCGLRTKSMSMSVKDYLAVEKPELCDLSE